MYRVRNLVLLAYKFSEPLGDGDQDSPSNGARWSHRSRAGFPRTAPAGTSYRRRGGHPRQQERGATSCGKDATKSGHFNLLRTPAYIRSAPLAIVGWPNLDDAVLDSKFDSALPTTAPSMRERLVPFIRCQVVARWLGSSWLYWAHRTWKVGIWPTKSKRATQNGGRI